LNLEDIKGLGKTRIEKLRAVGIVRPLDLLLHFPYKYVELDARADIDKLKTGDELTVAGTVINEPVVKFLRKGLRLTQATLQTQYGEIEAAWFNQKYIKAALPKGKFVCLHGKIKKFRNKITLSAPVIVRQNGKNTVALYRNIPGIPQSVFSEAVDMLLSCADVHGYIPESVRANHGLPPLGKAFCEVHRPTNIISAHNAARALSLEKLSYSLCMFSAVKAMASRSEKFEYSRDFGDLKNIISSLPFELTRSQTAALKDIIASLKSETPMNRLLQGDVGCGKTVIALLAMYFAYLNGYQSVLMAPTEILAVQHYKSAIKFLECAGAKAVLLSGSLNKTEREQALFNIENKVADIVIGTHALLSDDVRFAKPALIITDEQQRFGVNQRGKLESKAPNADILVMTATPIPRTLALTLYGELEQSCITALPAGRPEIITSAVPEKKFEGMFDYVLERARLGEGTYIVCPRIDSDEEEELVSAAELYARLKAKYACVGIGLLHGKLKDSEKNEIMGDFSRGKIKVLVATTVIEVGIDVPSAANIIIFNSERYGLSQLHQLRGRVGRGDKKSYCFLPVKGTVPERLEFFRNCNNGFELSEYDFEKRGAGDFIGTRQHGDAEELPVKIDAALISEAKAISEEVLRDADAAAGIKAAAKSGAEQYVRTITMN